MRQDHIDQIKYGSNEDPANNPCGTSGVPASVCQCAICNPNFVQELLNDNDSPVIGADVFQVWHLRYFAEPNGQRYGQAFLNHFDYLPEVAALREGSLIWEDNRSWSVQSKLREKGIIA